MKQTETRLMNFRIPVDLKKEFNQICDFKNTKMSNQLKILIRTFINKEAKKIIKTTNEPAINLWEGFIQNPISGILSKIKGY